MGIFPRRRRWRLGRRRRRGCRQWARWRGRRTAKRRGRWRRRGRTLQRLSPGNGWRRRRSGRGGALHRLVDDSEADGPHIDRPERGCLVQFGIPGQTGCDIQQGRHGPSPLLGPGNVFHKAIRGNQNQRGRLQGIKWHQPVLDDRNAEFTVGNQTISVLLFQAPDFFANLLRSNQGIHLLISTYGDQGRLVHRGLLFIDYSILRAGRRQHVLSGAKIPTLFAIAAFPRCDDEINILPQPLSLR